MKVFVSVFLLIFALIEIDARDQYKNIEIDEIDPKLPAKHIRRQVRDIPQSDGKLPKKIEFSSINSSLTKSLANLDTALEEFVVHINNAKGSRLDDNKINNFRSSVTAECKFLKEVIAKSIPKLACTPKQLKDLKFNAWKLGLVICNHFSIVDHYKQHVKIEDTKRTVDTAFPERQETDTINTIFFSN